MQDGRQLSRACRCASRKQGTSGKQQAPAGSKAPARTLQRTSWRYVLPGMTCMPGDLQAKGAGSFSAAAAAAFRSAAGPALNGGGSAPGHLQAQHGGKPPWPHFGVGPQVAEAGVDAHSACQRHHRNQRVAAGSVEKQAGVGRWAEGAPAHRLPPPPRSTPPAALRRAHPSASSSRASASNTHAHTSGFTQLHRPPAIGRAFAGVRGPGAAIRRWRGRAWSS